MLGKGDPILLVSGSSADKNAWDPGFISDLSSNHTVIIFDNRGVGNTTIGSQPFTIEQLANDTSGLLDALKIQNANVLGYSLGSWVAEQLTITYPEKVSRLILVGSSCGGKDLIPKPPEFLRTVIVLFWHLDRSLERYNNTAGSVEPRTISVL